MRADIVIYNLLKDSSNIFPFVIPQSTAITDGNVYMTYSVVETDSVTTKSSFNDYDRTTVQLSFFSSSLDAAMVKADAVRLLIDRYSAILTVATVEYDVDLISFVSQDFVGYDEDNEVYMIAADYQISLAPVYLFQQVVPCGSSLSANLGKTIRVGNFPLLWLQGGSGGYYDVYKGDTFLIAGTGCIWGGGVSDYAAVTNINLGNQSLTTNVNFLGKFPELVEIDVSGNNITNFEFPPSNKIEIVSIRSNNIDTIDTSNAFNLKGFSAADNSISGHLDFSNSNEIDGIFINTNSVDTIDLSGCVVLDELRAYGSSMKLDSIDLSDCVLLTNIHLKNARTSIIDFATTTLLIYIRLDGARISNTLNSTLLEQLDAHGLSNGYINSRIFGGGTLTTAGLAAKAALLLKGWTIVGL